MNVYVQCEGCGAKDHPAWIPGTSYGMQQMGTSGYWAQPEGWADVCGAQLCRVCADEARKVLREFVASRARPIGAVPAPQMDHK